MQEGFVTPDSVEHECRKICKCLDGWIIHRDAIAMKALRRCWAYIARV